MVADFLIHNTSEILTCAGPAPRVGSRQGDARPVARAAIAAYRGEIVFIGLEALLTRDPAWQDFTKQLISALNAASDSLTAADTNQEGANLLALQTRQSLSSTALSMASQSDQTVLRLFR